MRGGDDLIVESFEGPS